MKYINLHKLEVEKESLKDEWKSRKKFGYLIIEDFFDKENANELHDNYPILREYGKKSRTYLNGKGKYQKTTFEDLAIYKAVFDELNSRKFLKLIEFITGIENLLPDEELFGGGLHQSEKGAFLNVHIDFNIHPKSKHYRRLNIIVYMNKDWKKEYNGYLEFWDMESDIMLEKVKPIFNRCVIFETNEVSYHGHPHPINTPRGIYRNSIAAYYYTKEYPSNSGIEHSTVYVNTEGAQGLVKKALVGIKGVLNKVLKTS